MDVLKILKKNIVIRDESAISEIKDLVRVKTLIDDGFFGVGQKVQTESGQYLGRLYDFLVDSDNLVITKLYIKGLANERIIPATSIVSIEPKIITVKDPLDAIEATREALSETIA
ncbi:MAG: PRC-barrel domain-containing protein [Candidatus Berkelbacteria bacterium]